MTKVSTITPCYNMSKYMKGFLDNLSTQTHKDLEIILDHNDPTDEEITLVEEYNKEHDNIFHIVVEGVETLVAVIAITTSLSLTFFCMPPADPIRINVLAL